jgi:hypothetical protein
MAPNMDSDDPFEDVLNLEEQFYQEGYRQGQDDGLRAGLVEGRSLGLEKGFQKFFESGRLYGRTVVWANRFPYPDRPSQQESRASDGAGEASSVAPRIPENSTEQQPAYLPSLPHNSRLEKHITTLYALVESESLSTENTDEAVNDFDDRLKRAEGKAKIIERLAGEAHVLDGTKSHDGPGASKVKLEV